MADTLDDLYFKYIDRVGSTLEDDRYFQYLYTMVQAGNNVLQQKHRILNKVVDERWISTIEDSLDAINNIIDKPRRFIATSEEVVPVSLAKKITADSVRHLSMNTQFIAGNEDGNIQPTRILNVTTEESFDLYENRFIYHLIHRLIAFVDKRTDVIFWSTGNETSNTLSMESSVDDAYEQIDYKIEMTIKNTQSLVENDNDNMQVFMRIDRVRRLVFALRTSAFYSIMAGCAKVHSPIQRTNLMMKDPDYRKCYKLWQFMESYDEVGYTIVPEDSTLEFDEEYLIQMYTNMITNYTVFKSILETDERDLVELQKKRRRPIQPKFVKQIKEERVDNRDVPDVEVRRVFVEEVTQAQLDAEEKLKEMTSRFEEANRLREESEEAEAEAQRQMQELYQQLSNAMEMQMNAEEELSKTIEEHEAQLVKLHKKQKEQIDVLRQSHQEETTQLQQAYESRITAIEQEQKAQVTDLVQQHTQQVESLRSQDADQLSETIEGYETQLAGMKQEYETQIASMEETHASTISSMTEKYESQIAGMKADYETTVSGMTEKYESQIVGMKADYETTVSGMTEKYESQIAGMKEDYEAAISGMTEKYETRLGRMTEKYQTQIRDMQQEYETQINTTAQNYEAQITDLKHRYETQLADTTKRSEAQLQHSSDAHAKKIAALEKQYEDSHKLAVSHLTNQYDARIKKLEEEKKQARTAEKEAQSRMAKAEKARQRAEDKAEGTRLSRYIISNLSGKSKKQKPDDKEDKDT